MGRTARPVILVLLVLTVGGVAFRPGSARGAAAVEVQFVASAPVVTWGDVIRFTGTISSPDAPECAQGVELVLELDVIDDGERWIEAARARSDENGAFFADVRAGHPAMYRVNTLPEEGSGCDDAGAGGVEVMVRFEVTLERAALAVDRGETVKLRVRVEPFCPVGGPSGDTRKIPLYQLRGDQFVRVAAKRDVYDCTVTFTRRITRLSVFMSKVRANQEMNSVYLGSRSEELAVTVRN